MPVPAVPVRFRYAEPAVFGRITQAGLLRDSTGPAGQGPMRVLDSFALVYSLDGAARYRDGNGLDRAIGPGDAILVFPDLPHMYGPQAGGRWSEFYLVFDGPVFDLMRDRGLLDSTRPVRHAEPVDQWLARLESVTRAPRRPGGTLLEASRLVSVLADLLSADGGGEAPDADRRLVQRACALLESDLERDLDGPKLARQLGTSYESFRKRFTRELGVPPAKWRRGRLIERACELMQRGELNDKQIAARLGFCDEFHFSRRFKEVTGEAPRAFRRALSRSRA